MESIYMMKLIAKIHESFTNILNKNKNYLRLKSIYKKNNAIYCEFNELLRLDGKLIKYNIEEIANNNSLQESIFPKTLFIIGTIYGRYQNTLNEFRVKISDVKNNLVTLENTNEKIVISINDLIYDENLIQQINQLDLLRLIFAYAYKLGYQINSSLDIDTAQKKVAMSDMENNDNVISLF